jgi:23S rRNA (guanine745-N1)-methyltransferase
MDRLACPVRRCCAPLAPSEKSALVCANGHAFDVARSGYVNLLQPQDRRSKNPGDSREAAAARRRLAEAGFETSTREALGDELARLEGVSDRGAGPLVVADIGCGEGFFLGSLAAERPMDAYGLDISSPAIEMAAKKYPGPTWLVGNADRFLPWRDGSVAAVLSITSRRNAGEFQRVLSPSGRVIVAVPGEDDLIELRQALMGLGTRRDRAASVIEEVATFFELESRRSLHRRNRVSAAHVQDLLATTYRGGRPSRQAQADGLGDMDLTFSRELLVFRKREQ